VCQGRELVGRRLLLLFTNHLLRAGLLHVPIWLFINVVFVAVPGHDHGHHGHYHGGGGMGGGMGGMDPNVLFQMFMQQQQAGRR
jgi:hypothetical protein